MDQAGDARVGRCATRRSMKCDDVVRAFIAVEVGRDVKSRCSDLQAEARGLRARVRWVKTDAMHLTLAFLGDIFVAASEEVARAMDEVAGTVAPFSCSIQGVGVFGRKRAPRVVWAGVDEGAVSLGTVYDRLTGPLRGLAIRVDDRPLVPHLTLGRVKSTAHSDELLAFLEARRGELLGEFDVDRIVLVSSRLTPDGPVYSHLHASPLSG